MKNIHHLIAIFLLAATSCTTIAPPTTRPTTLPSTQPSTQPAVDDAPAVQALLKAGTPLPSGAVYNFASTVHLTNQAVNINKVTINTSPTAQANLVLFGLVNCSGSITANLIDGNRTARGNDPGSNGTLMILLSCHDLKIDSNTFQNTPADCIRVAATNPQDATTACQRVRITGNTFTSCWRNLISVIGGSWITIEGNHFSYAINGQTPNAAVDVEANGPIVDATGQVIYPGDAPNINHDIDIVNNDISNCAIGLGAMRQIVQTRVRYIGNTISSCTVSGIDNEADQAEICSNTLTGCGIGCDNCDGGMITSNIVQGSGQGIYCDVNRIVNPTGHTVSGNWADGTIDVHYCYGHVTLSGNHAQTVSQ